MVSRLGRSRARRVPGGKSSGKPVKWASACRTVINRRAASHWALPSGAGVAALVRLYGVLAGPLGRSQPTRRVLRSTAQDNGLRLLLEGRGGRTYRLFVRSPHQLAETTGVKVGRSDGPDQELILEFKGSPDDYSRLDVTVPFIRR